MFLSHGLNRFCVAGLWENCVNFPAKTPGANLRPRFRESRYDVDINLKIMPSMKLITPLKPLFLAGPVEPVQSWSPWLVAHRADMLPSNSFAAAFFPGYGVA